MQYPAYFRYRILIFTNKYSLINSCFPNTGKNAETVCLYSSPFQSMEKCLMTGKKAIADLIVPKLPVEINANLQIKTDRKIVEVCTSKFKLLEQSVDSKLFDLVSITQSNEFWLVSEDNTSLPLVSLCVIVIDDIAKNDGFAHTYFVN